MLEDAGISASIRPSSVDEAAIKGTLADTGGARLAATLADAKAVAVSRECPGDWVLGADQVLDCAGTLYDKPVDRAAARHQLLALRGRTHVLHTAVSLARDGVVDWRRMETPALAMRAFSDAFLDAYLDLEGDAVLSSVGSYRVEGPGIQLFDTIEGDSTAIRGLPLLPVLAALRARGLVPS